MEPIISFSDDLATDHGAVGGKAASLGKLVDYGFPVPPGFTVSTAVHSAFLEHEDLAGRIQAIVAEINYDDPDALEAETQKIRDLIVGTRFPADLESQLEAAYAELGDEPYVAVRSSGTAEDLADASFAGLHDTFLDVRGADAVAEAVRKCWASMWTARATAYRHRGGHDQELARLAVVVQKMVTPEVSGVMFTANPGTLRTDEIVINASWGLGEGIVSGILTPDELVLSVNTLEIKKASVGDKEKKVVRNPETQVGTVVVETEAAERKDLSLSDEQAKDLAELGREVMEKYGGLPQDMEWALADGELYLLQARPVTGAEFTWDEDVDGWQPAPEEEDTVWTYTWSEMYWTGGISPLFYSCRAYECYLNYSRFANLFGFEDLTNVRWQKYQRATAYFNADAEKSWLTQQWPSKFRDLTNIPPAWQEDFLAAKTSVTGLAKLWLRVHTLNPELGVQRWWKSTYDYLDNRTDEADGPSAEAIRRMSDQELLRQAEARVAFVDEWYITLWPGFFWLASGAFGGLALILDKWYDGDNEGAYQDLVSGIPGSKMTEETKELWELSDMIRQDSFLRETFDKHEGGAFFEELERHEEGKAFLESYRSFLHNHGHRGHQDRDFYYFRRIEKPSLDYDAFKALLEVDDPVHPDAILEEMVAKREATTQEVVDNLSKKPFGSVRAAIFQYVTDYCEKFLRYREDERHYLDRLTFGKKKIFLEIGKRMHERGMIEEQDDFWFLARHELYAHFEGRSQEPLARAKMASRKSVFHRRNDRQEYTPTWIQNGIEVDLSGVDVDAEGEEGVLVGIPTSRGEATGPSRIVPQLDQVGKVKQGDILVCNSTDPGWMSVFPKIKGLVLETGGMLAHGACLSREYGIPAVQVRGAMERIDDVVEITVDGDRGTVRVQAAENGAANGDGAGGDGAESSELAAAAAGEGE